MEFYNYNGTTYGYDREKWLNSPAANSLRQQWIGKNVKLINDLFSRDDLIANIHPYTSMLNISAPIKPGEIGVVIDVSIEPDGSSTDEEDVFNWPPSIEYFTVDFGPYNGPIKGFIGNKRVVKIPQEWFELWT